MPKDPETVQIVTSIHVLDKHGILHPYHIAPPPSKLEFNTPDEPFNLPPPSPPSEKREADPLASPPPEEPRPSVPSTKQGDAPVFRWGSYRDSEMLVGEEWEKVERESKERVAAMIAERLRVMSGEMEEEQMVKEGERSQESQGGKEEGGPHNC